ncbi:MAG: helix-turn-helix transcriptional regulator [Candidatus Methanospirareceae archaeon]
MDKVGLAYILIVVIAITAPVVGYNGNGDDYYFSGNESYFNQLILNIYVDETGKALVTGYVEDVNGLPFLKTAEYLYENDTNQLYALTNSLTWKYGDNWEINFTTNADAYYTEYHTIFYLPGDVKLVEINHPQELERFVTTSNESLVIDIQGYDVESPMSIIEYQQPLKETGGEEGGGFSVGYLLLIIVLLVLTLALIITIAKMKRREDVRHAEEPQLKVYAEKGKIGTTAEMARVMETLTDRERAIVNALLKHNGEMTQADLRYETDIPKSSLTGILRTLERRKIINKKEWGRTNVIELSEWFLSRKGGE